MISACPGIIATDPVTGSKVVAPVARVDSVGPFRAWVLMAAAAVPVNRTATRANEVVNFDFMSSFY